MSVIALWNEKKNISLGAQLMALSLSPADDYCTAPMISRQLDHTPYLQLCSARIMYQAAHLDVLIRVLLLESVAFISVP